MDGFTDKVSGGRRDLMSGSLDRLASSSSSVSREVDQMSASAFAPTSSLLKGSSVVSSISSDSTGPSSGSPPLRQTGASSSKRSSFVGFSRLSLDSPTTPGNASMKSSGDENMIKEMGSSYHYVCESHQKSLAARIQGLLDRKKLCDVVLISGPKRISAHRLILSAASDYFAAMFTGGMTETVQTEIEILNVDPQALEILINFCYTGEVMIEEGTVENILGAACLLQLSPVIEACSEFLKTQLDPSNCLGIRSFADIQGCHRLHNSAQNYITDNFSLITTQQEFLELPADELSQLLSSDDLNVSSEETIFRSLCAWIQHDPGTRKQHASRLLTSIRLPFLSPEFLSDKVENHPSFKDDRASQELIMEAMKYHLLPSRRSCLQLGLRTKPRKATVGQMLAFGGMDSTKGPMSIEAYSLLKNSWRKVGVMSGRRQQFGMAVMNGKVFVVGGRDGLKTLNTFECWDPNNGKWYPMPPMTTGRHGLGVAMLSGPLYAVGGHDGWSYLSSAERWDPQTQTWSPITEMSTPRSTAGVAVLNGRLYVAGGRDSSQVLRSAEYYNPHTNKWTAVRSMNRKRSSMGLGVLNGYLYAVGGMESQSPAGNPSSIRYSSVERYDPQLDEWTLVASLSTGRDGVGVGCLGDTLYAVGGFDGHKFLSIVECYDPEANKWNTVSNLVSGRTGTGIAVLSGQDHQEKKSSDAQDKRIRGGKLNASTPSLANQDGKKRTYSSYLPGSSSIETL